MLKVDLAQKKSQLWLQKLQNRAWKCSEEGILMFPGILFIILIDSSSVSIGITRDAIVKNKIKLYFLL